MFTLYKKREFLFKNEDRLDAVNCIVEKLDNDHIYIDFSISDSVNIINYYDVCDKSELKKYYEAFDVLRNIFENVCNILKEELES